MIIRGLFALYYLPRCADTLVYMLQNTEYRAVPYLAWFWRTQDFSRVMYRRKLDRTKSAKLLRLALVAGMSLQVMIGLALLDLWWRVGVVGAEWFGLALLVSYPVVWAHLVVLPQVVGREFIVKPKEKRLVLVSERIFAKHPGKKIAVAGSYGKTSMKELLLTVLNEGKKVAATPGNMNVAVSHAKFAQSLNGDEDVLIIEYGEGQPHDVERFAAVTHPTHGVITGLAPAHLDRYKTLEAAGEDIFSLALYLKNTNVYVNGESPAAKPFIKKTFAQYDANGTLGWRARNIKLGTAGVDFELAKGKQKLRLHSGLLGRHQIGPISLAAALALELGLTKKQVIDGVAKTLPHEHRMQPYQLAGATVIDDTYNGNIEGVRAGTALLADLDAKRKLYVTPGLVDQGAETEAVHIEMGKLIAKAKPDMVVLMRNSTTGHIEEGLRQGKFKGEVRIEDDPLGFYANLDQMVAVGDLVLMQNDWPDNYA